MSRLRADGLTLGYAGPAIVQDLDVALLDGKVTAIVGANACGKSTLLRGLARLLKPRAGVVTLDGRVLAELSTLTVAKELGLLPQTPLAPDGITVADLVSRGRTKSAVPVASMALAQETGLLLLDEPTTHLDINHQVELLRLLRTLNADSGKTIVVVLHDLNLACRFCDHVIAMADGRIVAEGAPTDVITAELVRKVFGLECVIVPDPVAGTPMIVPT